MLLRKRLHQEKNFYAKKQVLYRVESLKLTKKRQKVPGFLQLFKISLQTYILRNLLRKTQPPPPLVIEVQPKVIKFFVETFSITKRYTTCDEVLRFFDIKPYQYMTNCKSNNNTKFFIKEGSFKIRMSNNGKVKSTEEGENGEIFTTTFPKNVSISVKFVREMVCELTEGQKDILDAFRQEKLKKIIL